MVECVWLMRFYSFVVYDDGNKWNINKKNNAIKGTDQKSYDYPEERSKMKLLFLFFLDQELYTKNIF